MTLRQEINFFGGDRSLESAKRAGRFEAMVDPLVPLILRYFVRRLDNRDDAADCTAETLLVLWRRRAKLPPEPDELRAWSYGVARLVLANHQRGTRRRAAVDHSLRQALRVPNPPPPDEAIVAVEALKSLRGADQELLRLVVWDQLSVTDAGRVLGITPGAARTRYSRALARLRDRFAAIND